MELYKSKEDFIFYAEDLGTLLLRPIEVGWMCIIWTGHAVLSMDTSITIEELFEEISPEQVLKVVDKYCKSL